MCALMALMNMEVPPISVKNEIRGVAWTRATIFKKKRCPEQQNNFSASHYRSVKGCSNAIKYIFICVPLSPIQLQLIFPGNIDLTVTFKV